MSAGTLTLTNNSDLVSGAGTSFSTELTAGDFVVATVGGVTYTLPVKSVEGDTEITLISKYPGPTQQGSAWNAVPRATQNQVTVALVVQSTEALRGLNYDKQNWQAVFSTDGHITVMLPDGSSFSGPSWKSIAETLSTLDVDYLNQLAAQINHDAQQVETDKNTVVDTAQQVSTDALTASTAATGAQGSATDAAQSETNAEGYKDLARKYALNPEDSPVTSNEYSSFHYSEKSRKSAEEAASHNPVEALVKSLNLSDLADRAAAWLNLRPLGSTPLAGDPVNPYDATTMRWVENYVSGGGGTGPTMNGVQNFGIGTPMLWASRAFVPSWGVIMDGQLLNRADWPELWAHAQMHTPIEDADWLADPTKRGAYSNGDGATTFRVPDYNGVQPGSYVGLYGRGDAGGGYVTQSVIINGAPDIVGTMNLRQARAPAGELANNLVGSGGAFSTGTGTTGQYGPISLNSTLATAIQLVTFKASDSHAAYGRASDVRPNSFIGVWIVRASGGFTAANTLWTVTNADTTTPPTGTVVNGGGVRSVYDTTDGSTKVTAELQASTTSGSPISYAVIRSDSGVKVGELKVGSDGSLLLATNSEINTVPANGVVKANLNWQPLAIVTTRTDGGVGVTVTGGENSAGILRNNLKISAAASGAATGSFANWLSGDWYAGSWQLGSIRSSSTVLARVQLNVADGVGGTASYMFNPNGTAQAAQWQSTSDRRIKSCIETIPNPLEVMRSIRGYSWFYEPYGTQGFGFMADEAEKHFPGAVKTTDDFELEMPDGSKIDDVKSVDTYGIAAALHHEAILAMMDQIAELKAEIKKLKGE